MNVIERLTLFICMLFFCACSVATSVTFEHGDHQLSGHYLDATGNLPTKGVLIFVHGDGAMTYDAEGYYSIFWEPLRKRGFAVFSWDKAGVGDSGGNWLLQSMEDRQDEVKAAIEFVQSKYGFRSENTGLVGFSQAGWVVPALANKQMKVGFSVGIGYARNWLEQGRYLTETRLKMEGKSAQEIAKALADNEDGVAFLRKNRPYEDYLQTAGADPMTEQRYQFVLRNFEADASTDYGNIAVPTLLLWGEDDLNVDARSEYNWWQSQSNPWVKTGIVKGASHGMLDSDTFDTQLMSVSQWLKLMWREEDAFAQDFFPQLITWLEGRLIEIQT